MSNDNDIWTLEREPDETDAEYEARAAMFRKEFDRQLPDGRTIAQALVEGDAIGLDLRENLEGLAELDRGEGVDFDDVMAEAEAIISAAEASSDAMPGKWDRDPAETDAEFAERIAHLYRLFPPGTPAVASVRLIAPQDDSDS